MSSIPEGLPPERAGEFSGVGKKAHSSPEEQKIQDVEIASLGGMPTTRTGSLISGHDVANLTPLTIIPFFVEHNIPFLAAQAVVNAIHEEHMPKLKGFIEQISSFGDTPEGQDVACHEMSHQIQEDSAVDERSKSGFRSFFKAYQPVIKIESGDTKTYFNGSNIDIVGLQPGQSAQQHIQNLIATGLVPQQHVQQFQAAAPNAKIRTPQQSQAAQAKGKAAAAKWMQAIHAVAITIAQQQKAEKEETLQQTPGKEQAPSSSPSRQKASTTVEREIYEASYLFDTTVKSKKERAQVEELQKTRQQKAHLHEEEMTLKTRQKKQKARKVLSEEKKAQEKKTEEKS